MELGLGENLEFLVRRDAMRKWK